MRPLIPCVILFSTFYVSGQSLDEANHNRSSFRESDISATSVNRIHIVSLYRVFNQISDDDSVTNALITDGWIAIEGGEEMSRITMNIDSVVGAIRIEKTESGNSSFVVTEYRAVKADNALKLIQSRFFGTNAFTSQGKIEVYDYSPTTRTFRLDAVSTMIFRADVKDFFDPKTPDSIVTDYLSHSSHFFHIVYNRDGVAEYILFDHYSPTEQKNNKWIIGNTIKIELDVSGFSRSKPYWSE